MPAPTPCNCPTCPNLFSAKAAENGLKRYRRHGPDATTRALIAAIAEEGVQGSALLDIGGGIGAISLELLGAGVASAESVDASAPYIEVAEAEAARRGYAERTTYRIGDFVAVADEVPPADIVTLDRMICCYGDVASLLARSADHARRMVGLVYPRDDWWVRAMARVLNAGSRLVRRPLRWYIHGESVISGLMIDAGFERRVLRRFMLWRVVLYVRAGPLAPAPVPAP